MVFIDGSWLYYSFHGRRPNCPVQQRHGDGWAFSNSVAFDRLPYLISQHIHQQLLRRYGTRRFVEITRTMAPLLRTRLARLSGRKGVSVRPLLLL